MTTSSGPRELDPAFRVLSLVARELQGVFGHIGRALDAHLAGEELPEPLYGDIPAPATAIPKRRGRPKKAEGEEKRPRKPTAFNIFVKRRVEALKAEGVVIEQPRGLFMRAVEDWGNLTEAQRETFVKEYKAELEDEEGAGTPAPPPQSGEPAPAAPVAAASPATQASPEAADAAGAEQKEKKKKKKRHVEEGQDIVSSDGEHKKKKKKRKQHDKSGQQPGSA